MVTKMELALDRVHAHLATIRSILDKSECWAIERTFRFATFSIAQTATTRTNVRGVPFCENRWLHGMIHHRTPPIAINWDRCLAKSSERRPGGSIGGIGRRPSDTVSLNPR